jgi:hypothetical protein
MAQQYAQQQQQQMMGGQPTQQEQMIGQGAITFLGIDGFRRKKSEDAKISQNSKHYFKLTLGKEGIEILTFCNY